MKSKTKKIRLDIGCGKKKKDGFIGLDMADYRKLYKKDEFIRHDLNKGLPFADGSVDEIYSEDCIEHLHLNSRYPIVAIMDELWRVCKPGARVKLIVPFALSASNFNNPTHINNFLPETFKYFTKDGFEWDKYTTKFWKIIKLRLTPPRALRFIKLPELFKIIGFFIPSVISSIEIELVKLK
ncbi:methyltransferase domain-containing protein [candidate division KSB1 bacterium]